MRWILVPLLLFPFLLSSQISRDSAAFYIKEIYRQSYTELQGYKWLTTLTKDIGTRLSGSEGAANAVKWAFGVLDTLRLDSVWLQEVKVTHWERGEKEYIVLLSPEADPIELKGLALGKSPGTGPDGLRGEVIEVKSLDQLRAMPVDSVAGRIVFFNRPMDAGLPNTFSAYGAAADQRVNGPPLAAEKGAIAAVVRSLTIALDDNPHAGVTNLSKTAKNIPSIAISTNDADRLSNSLKRCPTSLFIRTNCELAGEVISYNVIGEIRGSEFPDEIILIGGHLDAWDVGEGAYDDGSGCAHSIEVMYRLLKNRYQPKRTIRCVLFMDEENGVVGGLKYAAEAIRKNEYHMVAIESDLGGATPQYFGCSAGDGVQLDYHLAFMGTYMNLLEPYFVQLKPGGGGADIGPLKPKVGVMIGLYPDGARYFDFHHSGIDVLENVHPRELASGSAALTSLIYLIDQYGIGK